MEEENNDNVDFIDDKEFQARFLLDPDIKDEADFSHLDKNLAITNLRQTEKTAINEPEQVRSILRGLHVLNNNRYFKKVLKPQFSGYREATTKDSEGNTVVVKIPEYTQVEKLVSRFPKTFHSLKAEVYSFVNTSASRSGHRIKAAQTRRSVREETIEERNNVKKQWGGNNYRRNY